MSTICWTPVFGAARTIPQQGSSAPGVIAREHPGPLTKIVMDGLAAAGGASRVTGKKDLPTDVLGGRAPSGLIAQQGYPGRHKPEFAGAGRTLPPQDSEAERQRHPGNLGSPYVPLGSWTYSAFERLAGWGYLDSAFLGLRPWTRLECARLLEETEDRLRARGTDQALSARLIASLKQEFAHELDLLAGARNRSLELESVYTRFTGIAGQALNDGYHFGQTITNDFGRPYADGFNNVTGFSGWGASGPFTAYVQGEYQHAPAAVPLAMPARQFIADFDHLPLPPSVLYPAVERFRLLDAYVAMNLENWQVSFGKQSLWWGPGEGGSMTFSDNAEPVTMLRINRLTPFKLPSLLGLMGPIRVEFFVGQLSGHRFTYGKPTGLLGEWESSLAGQPMIDGEKLSFKPTPNLEFGISSTAIFAGAGVPLTFRTFFRSLVSRENGPPGCVAVSESCPKIDPGDRRAGFDLTYRLPGLRDWVTFYTDSFTDDQFSPLAYIDRSANSAGLYFSHLPKLPKFDLRLEGVYTDNPLGGLVCCGFYYFNDRYRNGYTNDGNLMGSWVGRDGQGAQAWLTYWHSPRNYLRFRYRHQEVSQQFVPNGGNISEGGIEASFWLGPNLSTTASLQYERWNFPVLRPGPNSNFTTALQVIYWPHWRWR